MSIQYTYIDTYRGDDCFAPIVANVDTGSIVRIHLRKNQDEEFFYALTVTGSYVYIPSTISAALEGHMEFDIEVTSGSIVQTVQHTDLDFIPDVTRIYGTEASQSYSDFERNKIIATEFWIRGVSGSLIMLDESNVGANGTNGTSGVNGTSGTSAVGQDGTSGTSGVDGTSGIGHDGTDGTSGTSGVSVNGTNGTSGTSGLTVAGSSGSSGTSGKDGEFTGSSGTSGLDGTSGTSGQNGTSGTSAVGSSGSSGTSGITVNGTNGIDGTNGTSGITVAGSSGSSGSSGTSGLTINGTNGIDGSSGTSGVNGTSGTSSNGTSGTSGIDGVIGTSGADGTSGTSGVSGNLSVITITGTQDSSNKVFTMSSALADVAKHLLFFNGQLLKYSVEYTISGSTLTFSAGFNAPTVTDSIVMFGDVSLGGGSGTSGSSGSSGTSGIGVSGTSGVDGMNGTSGIDGAGATINNNVDNNILTATGNSGEIEGESNLTFDGATLQLTSNSSSYALGANGMTLTNTDEAGSAGIQLVSSAGTLYAQSMPGEISIGSDNGWVQFPLATGDPIKMTAPVDVNGVLQVTGSVDITGGQFKIDGVPFEGGSGASFPYTGSAIISGSLQVIGSSYGDVISASIVNSTASIDLSQSNFFTSAVTEITHFEITNPQPGQTVNILITVSGVDPIATFSPNVKMVSGSRYIPTGVDGSKDILTLVSFDSTNVYVAKINNLA